MKKIKDFIKREYQNNKSQYFILFLLLLSFVGIFSLDRSAADTYSLESYQYMFNDGLPYFTDGRFFMTGFVLLFRQFHLSYHILKVCSWIIAFSSIYLSIILINQMFLITTERNHYWLSFLLVLNIFVVEFFVYADYAGIMCLGILFSAISSYLYLLFLHEKKKKYLFFSMMASLCTTFCYQGVISLVVLFPIMFTLKYSNNIKKFINNTLSLVCVYSVPTLSALLIGKIIGTSRLNASLTFQKSAIKIFTDVRKLLEYTAYILPKYLFLGLFVFNLIVILIIMFKQKKKIYEYLFLIYCIVACIFVPLFPQFIIGYENIWIVPRSNVGLGILVIYPILFSILYLKPEKYYLYFLGIAMFILTYFEFRGYLNIGYNQIKTNALERKELNQIVEKIDRYQTTGQKIENISIYYDNDVTYSYGDIMAFGDINTRTLAKDWGIKAMLYHSLKKSLNEVNDDDFNEYCHANNWIEMNDENVQLENNTLYICIY